MADRRGRTPRRLRKQGARDELQLFGRNTSMRGVPRIIKAESIPLKIIWGIAVLALLCLAVFQVVEIVTNYFEYEVYTSVQEMSFHPSKDKPVFPTITICNENPFSSLPPDETMGILNINKFYDQVIKYALCQKYTFLKIPKKDYLCEILLSNEAYFQYIGSNNARLVGHTQEEFIADCHVLILSGLIYDRIPCDNLVNISMVQSVKYFNCFRLDLTNDYFKPDGLIAGLSVVLHLSNTGASTNAMGKNNRQVNPIGAILTSHHPGMPAFPALDGTLIPAGASSRIQAEIKQRIRLPKPYGSCIEDHEYVGYEQMKTCVARCMSDTIIDECGCIHVKLAVEIQYNSSMPYCFDINAYSKRKLLAQASCVKNVSSISLFEHCVDQCPQSCMEYQYVDDWSFSNWPSILDLEHFYKAYIQDKPYEKHYKHLKHEMTKPCTDIADCLSKKSLAAKVIENNFIEVSYRLSDHRYIRFTDVAKNRIADVCSKVGGVLNLWSGITVIVFLELLEMFCRILKNWGQLIRHGNDPGAPRNIAQM